MTAPTEVGPRSFLTLCQDTARECGVNNTQSADVPSSVSGQTGELGRIVRWVQRAWRDIQGRRHYSWMWERATLTLPLATNEIAGTIPSERYERDSALRVTPNSDGRDLEYIPWDEWSDWYSPQEIAAAQNAPTVFTIRPDNALVFNGIPSIANGGAMTFTVDRYKNPTELRLDTDEPGMPPDLQDLIVYKAMVLYANFDEAGTTRATAVSEIARLEQALISRCMSQLRLGNPLVE